jgi:DNA-binding response OmpR family regulator
VPKAQIDESRYKMANGKITLIVEDDLIHKGIIQDILSHKGFQVFSASNLQEALTIIKREKTMDIAILDIHLPDGLGTNLIPDLKDRYPLIKIIVCSSVDKEDVKTLLQGFAIHKFIQKPFDPMVLLNEIL